MLLRHFFITRGLQLELRNRASIFVIYKEIKWLKIIFFDISRSCKTMQCTTFLVAASVVDPFIDQSFLCSRNEKVSLSTYRHLFDKKWGITLFKIWSTFYFQNRSYKIFCKIRYWNFMIGWFGPLLQDTGSNKQKLLFTLAHSITTIQISNGTLFIISLFFF